MQRVNIATRTLQQKGEATNIINVLDTTVAIAITKK
jgi:hypothetical protein